MLKNSPLSFSKGPMSLLLALSLMMSCTKSYDPGNLNNDRIAILTGKPQTVNWVLHSIRTNNQFDTTARGTYKVYHADGSFTDNLGFVGFWTMVSRDSLIESTRSSVNPNAPFFTNHFHIDRLDKRGLQLTYKNLDQTIKIVYEANR